MMVVNRGISRGRKLLADAMLIAVDFLKAISFYPGTMGALRNT